jgi:hypothetical protein
VQVQREVKRRAGETSQRVQRGDPLVDRLAHAAQDAPGSTNDGGGATYPLPKSGAEVLALARRRGILR